MSTPRDPGRDLRLERLGDRDGLRSAHFAEAAQVRSLLGPASSVREFLAAYQALIDAVFTAPGAAEWLSGLRLRMAARLTGKDTAPPDPATREAIRTSKPGPWRD